MYPRNQRKLNDTIMQTIKYFYLQGRFQAVTKILQPLCNHIALNNYFGLHYTHADLSCVFCVNNHMFINDITTQHELDILDYKKFQ